MEVALLKESLHQGHNVLILGQAGTGKTQILKDFASCHTHKDELAMTASTGIAASLIHGVTIHRFAGLLDGRYTSEILIKKIMQDTSTRMRILNTKILVIDEVSMLSARMFTLLEETLRGVRQNDTYFGGIQVVLAGDLYQLRPVPNMAYNDPGHMIVSAPRFKEMVPHFCILEQVYRQEEVDLVKAVRELAVGDPGEETLSLMLRLSRPLPPGDQPIYLFARRYDVDKCNADHLMRMPGECHTFRSSDSGDIRTMNSTCPAPAVLRLKPKAPVVLVINLSDNLVNGLLGTVQEITPDLVTVQFPLLGKNVPVRRNTFTQYSPERKVNVASRIQFPLNLAFSLTVHKAQGMTLHRLEVDCRHMTNPGQIGVAVGRACSKKGLRIINFHSTLLRRHPQSLTAFYHGASAKPQPDLACCRNFSGVSQQEEIISGQSRCPSLECLTEAEVTLSTDMLDTDDTEISEPITDQELLLSLSLAEDGNAEDLVLGMEVQEVLRRSQYDEPVTPQQAEMNVCVRHILTHNQHLARFARKLNDSLQNLFDITIPQDPNTVVHKNLTAFYREVAVLISSPQYKQYVGELFEKSIEQLRSVEFRTAFTAVAFLRARVVERRTRPLVAQAEAAVSTAGVTFEQSGGGRASIRYIAGWAIASLIYVKKQAVTKSLYKKSRDKVDSMHSEILLLELLIEDEQYVTETTTDKASLSLIDCKQNIRRGLSYVSDNTFAFFMKLDKQVKELESHGAINFHGDNLFKYLNEALLTNNDLSESWSNLFKTSAHALSEDKLDLGTVRKLHEEVLHKYVSMSLNQLRKTYVRELKKEKEEAHRKQIKIKSDKFTSKCDFAFIEADTSPQKEVTHCRLQSELKANSNFFNSTLFTKDQLLAVCGAYQVAAKKHEKKALIAKKLGEAVIAASGGRWHDGDSDDEQPSTSAQRNKRSRVVEWPCGVCGSNCQDACVCCDKCQMWIHYACIGLTGDEDELQEEYWYCKSCCGSM